MRRSWLERSGASATSKKKAQPSDRDTHDDDVRPNGSLASGHPASRFPLFLFLYLIACVRGGAASVLIRGFPHYPRPGALHMQTTDNVTTRFEGAPTGRPVDGQAQGAQALAPQTTFADYKVIRRNGSVVSFEPSKIAIAVTKAFLAVNGGQGAASARVRELVEELTQSVVRALLRSRPNGGTFHIEDIQDQVELALMRGGEHNVARAD